MCFFKNKKKVPQTAVPQEDIDRALTIIATGRYNHQYYVDHPEGQTDRTGDTFFNRLWVDNYDLLRSVIERLNR